MKQQSMFSIQLTYFGTRREPVLQALSLCLSTESRDHNSLRVMHGISTTLDIGGQHAMCTPRTSRRQAPREPVLPAVWGAFHFVWDTGDHAK